MKVTLLFVYNKKVRSRWEGCIEFVDYQKASCQGHDSRRLEVRESRDPKDVISHHFIASFAKY